MIIYVVIADGIVLGCDVDKETAEKISLDFQGSRVAEVELTNKRLSMIAKVGVNE